MTSSGRRTRTAKLIHLLPFVIVEVVSIDFLGPHSIHKTSKDYHTSFIDDCSVLVSRRWDLTSLYLELQLLKLLLLRRSPTCMILSQENRTLDSPLHLPCCLQIDTFSHYKQLKSDEKLNLDLDLWCPSDATLTFYLVHSQVYPSLKDARG